MKKILVTGGAGYIGSHTVVELFKAGYLPIIVDNFYNAERYVIDALKDITKEEVVCHEGDCNDKAFMNEVFKKENKIHGVIHFAAYKAVGESVQFPQKYYQNNINSLSVLLETMDKHGCEMLAFSSSCTVYGQPEKLPVTEESPVLPAESAYGHTKQICEGILQNTIKSPQCLKTIALRYFNPIGAHPSSKIGELPKGVPANLIPFVTQTAAGIREKLSVFGDDYNTPDGSCIRDYIHVVDLAVAHVKTIQVLENIEEDSYYDIINVGTGNGVSVLEVIKAFEEVTGQKLNYEIVPRRTGDVEAVYADVSKSTKVLNWKTEKTIQDSLRDAWNWQKKLSNL